jgi:phage tail sheath protein FI
MPEYLSPGVYVEEIPPRLRAIEGVSTSTAGFVGPAVRGAVPGYPLPFVSTGGFVVPLDPAPVLVTSFGEFVRQFGNPLPLPDPNDNAYLGHAARAFFDNGGKRLYVARVMNAASATSSQLTLSQGVVSRLARSAGATDTAIYLTSLRGVNVGTTLNFLMRSDDRDAISSPAIIAGTAPAPFALAAGDRFGVKVSGGSAVVMTAVTATQASAVSSAQPFVLTAGMTLQLRVGPTSEPQQTVAFQGADFGTIGAATAAEVAAVLNRDLTGVEVLVQPAGRITIRTDQAGSGALLATPSGTAAAALGFAVTPASGNVADLAHVTIAEIAALFPPPATAGFTVSDNGAGRIKLASVGVGLTTTIQIDDTAIPGTAAKLGLASGPAVPGSGSARTVNSYDTRSGRVTLDGPLGSAVDPTAVYVTAAGSALGPNGPRFWARSPGSWSGSVSVQVTSSDRSPVPIAAAALGTAKQVRVQNSASFYRGAIVEIDHGTSHSYHEVVDLAGNLLTLGDLLGADVTTASFARVVEIDITVADESGVSALETYRGLSWNQNGTAADLRRHYATAVNARSRLVYVQPPGSEAPALGSQPTTQPTTPNGFPIKLSAGTLGLDGATPGDADYIGSDAGPGLRTGLQSLKDLDEVRIIAAPGRTSAAVQNELITQCELLRYRFAVLDGEQDPAGGSVTSILAHRSTYDTSYAAYYAPWVAVTVGDNTLYLPPSGYAAGIYARVDNARGVWKAPANEVVQNVTGLKTNFTTGEQDLLNPRGVNAIRRFEGQGIRVWGARTLSSDPSVKYINVRRFLIFLEASIYRGTQWAVFEPNTPDTWGRVQDSVGAFLNTQWREGALFGRKPDLAYFVRCDETTMTADDVQNGRLICTIGVAIVRPAEFVIFRIEQITGFGNQ